MGIYARHDSEWYRVDGGGSTSVGTQWGDFTTNGDASEENTWAAPDSQGRIWKYAVYDVAGDYTINLTGGMYWVLTVGGGSDGVENVQYKDSGQPGLVNEGYWEFGNGPATLKVGAKGTYAGVGSPSSIESYGTQGVVRWGATNDGRGSQAETLTEDPTGYKSFITGTEQQYGVGRNSSLITPGKAGSRNTPKATDGCVIIATVDEEKTDYYPPGALPGLGGWATITDVKGKGKKYAYGDWVAYEWTADGELTTLNGGLVDALLVSGGAGGGFSSNQFNGQGAGFTGFISIGSSENILVGAGGTNGQLPPDPGKPSFIGSAESPPGGPDFAWSLDSDITGQTETYCKGAQSSPRPGKGEGGVRYVNGSSGCVIVRVPKDQDHFTDITGSEAGEPFDIPTTRQAVVEALEEKVEEAKEAVRDRRNERRRRR